MTTPTATPAEAYYAGIDIGGTKIAGGLVPAHMFASASAQGQDHGEPKTGAEFSLIGATRQPTPKARYMDSVLEVIRGLFITAEQDGHRVAAVGIGAPGVIDTHSGRVISAGPTMPGWAGTEIAREVRKAFGVPVAVHNDVRVLGLGESTFGAGRGYRRVLFVSLGTGVGGAIVSDGELIRSAHNTAGELRALWGKHPCGTAAVIEDFASGPGIATTYNEWNRAYRHSGQTRPAGPAASTGPAVSTDPAEPTGSAGHLETADPGLHVDVDLPEIMRRYRAGEHLARSVVKKSMVNAGKALGGFISAIDVDAVIVGGGVGNIGPEIREPLTRGIRQGAIGPARDVPVLAARLGVESPIIGAAYLAALAALGDQEQGEQGEQGNRAQGEHVLG